MGDRRQKRAWLRLVGAVDVNEPSGSAAKPLTTSLVDSTLGSIQGDDIWVALACIDAIENRAEVTLDLDLTKHFITLGLQRTSIGEDFDLESKHVRYKLAIRRMLLRYKRMTDVWTQVYSGSVEQKTSVEPSIASEVVNDNNENFDAWEDAADTTSSATVIPLLDFIKASPLDHAMHLASTRQDQLLAKYIQALPSALLRLLYPHRLTITKQLLLSTSAAKADIGDLLASRLLPDFSKGRESDVWTDRTENLHNEDDVSDSKEVIDALSLHHLSSVDESSSQDKAEDSLSHNSLLRFYTSCIDALERQSDSNAASIKLAKTILSDKLNISADEHFARLAEDLQLLQPLNHGRSSSRTCSSWTLKSFRDELNNRPELLQRQAMATLYLEGAKSDSDAIRAAREGAVPFLRSISQRSKVPVETLDQTVIDGMSHAILALADKNKIGIVTSLLDGGAQYGVEVSIVERAKITLACLLGTSYIGVDTQRQLGHLAESTLSTLQAVTLTGEESLLRESVGAALNHEISPKILPSQQYQFFNRLELPALRYYIERCRIHLSLCQRLAERNSALTVSSLFSAEGQFDVQVSSVTRIVRTFARERKSPSQWAELDRDLSDSVGKDRSFDALSDEDIVRLVIEGALQTGDSTIYNVILREHSGQFSDAEREKFILSASREFYDNATSTNVHQGDMKTAHEILMQSGLVQSTRIEQEKAFIEATSRLCSFRIQSMLRPGIPLAPIEIRLSSDRIQFIKRLLETKEDAYKTPDLILELAQKLCAVPSGSGGSDTNKTPSRPLIESRTLALLTEAALGQADYTFAQSSCERLVSNVSKLEKRVEQSGINQGQQHIQLEEVLLQIRESAYRSCFLLCNQYEWNDYGRRLTWCSYVLAYCPDDQIERYLKTWRQLEKSFRQDLIDNPPKDWEQLKAGAGTGGLVASSLASLGGGLGAFESLSPFGTLFGSNRRSDSPSRATQINESKSQVKDEAAFRSSGSPSSRAARLFDSIGGNSGNPSSGDGTYLDPAERAARAARRFFGGFAS